MSQFQNNKLTLMAIDYGTTNTGVALSIDGIVSPLKIINSKNFNHFQAELSVLIFKNRVKKLIVGLPLSANGGENAQSLLVRQVVNSLKKYIKIPIIYVNEYGSTFAALSNGVVSHASRRAVSKINDSHSAAIILETYLEELS